MDDLPYSVACERNREPIREVLAHWLPAPGRVIEIGAGTGQHAEYFAATLDHLRWLPTDRGEYLPGLRTRLGRLARDNVEPPVALDVTRGPWPDGPFDHAYTANTCHIMHWPEVEQMFAGVAGLLPAGGLFLAYGPFHRDGAPTSPSNERFDRSLRARDPGMGIRDDRAVAVLADEHGLNWIADEAMPANNRILIWRRRQQHE